MLPKDKVAVIDGAGGAITARPELAKAGRCLCCSVWPASTSARGSCFLPNRYEAGPATSPTSLRTASLGSARGARVRTESLKLRSSMTGVRVPYCHSHHPFESAFSSVIAFLERRSDNVVRRVGHPLVECARPSCCGMQRRCAETHHAIVVVPSLPPSARTYHTSDAPTPRSRARRVASRPSRFLDASRGRS
jgi:hypothetical protein